MAKMASDKTITVVLSRPSASTVYYLALWFLTLGLCAWIDAFAFGDGAYVPVALFALCCVLGIFRHGIFRTQESLNGIYANELEPNIFRRRIIIIQMMSVIPVAGAGIYNVDYGLWYSLIYLTAPVLAFVCLTGFSFRIGTSEYRFNGTSYEHAEDTVSIVKRVSLFYLVVFLYSFTKLDLLFTLRDGMIAFMMMAIAIFITGYGTKIDNPYRTT